MDCLKNKIIQLNEEKKQPINTKNGRKVGKIVLTARSQMSKDHKRVLNENDNTIRKIKLIH